MALVVAYPWLRVDGHYMIVQAQFGLLRISTLSDGYASALVGEKEEGQPKAIHEKGIAH
jgi:hypothetical protein